MGESPVARATKQALSNYVAQSHTPARSTSGFIPPSTSSFINGIEQYFVVPVLAKLLQFSISTEKKLQKQNIR